jgi:transcriptional regulator with XRE-family HTH domain
MDQNLLLNTDSSPTNDSPEMRARRLKRLRNLANLSREQMSANGDIKRNTLIGWENGRFGGLTSGGAIKVLAKVSQEGVHCSLDWLMHGKGPEPSVNPLPLIQQDDFVELNEEIVIAYELAFFKAKNLNAVDMIVEDEGMHPQFKETDCVAGKKKIGKDIQLTIGCDCIVETEDGEVLLRNVREGKDPYTYTLICNNPAIKNRSSVVLNVKLKYAAPVIWHRKKES